MRFFGAVANPFSSKCTKVVRVDVSVFGCHSFLHCYTVLDLEFWYFRWSCSILKDNPRYVVSEQKHQVLSDAMTWKLLNLQCLLKVRGSFETSCSSMKSSLLTLVTRLLSTMKEKRLFYFFKRMNGCDDCSQKMLVSHSPGFHAWAQELL